jgi:WD40 repeat protein
MTTGGLVGRTLHFDHGLGAASGDPSARRFITAEGDGVHVRSFSHPTSGRLIPDSKFGAGAISDRTVVIARADGKLRVLDAATLKQDGADLPSTVGLVFQMALTRDGKRLLVVGTDGTARIADMATRQVIGDAITLGPTVPGPVVIRPDGRALAFGDARGGITVWNLDPRAMVRAACQVASRNLTEAEWGEYAKALGPYQRVCPDQPATRGGR